jgi:hypothetical protein
MLLLPWGRVAEMGSSADAVAFRGIIFSVEKVARKKSQDPNRCV